MGKAKPKLTAAQLKARLRARDDAWNEGASAERNAWLGRPRLHTAIFEEAWRDSELAKRIAESGITVLNAEELAQKRREQFEKLNDATKTLSWSEERLALFTEMVVKYRKNPSIENYVGVRRTFPEVEIQIARLGGMESLFALEGEFKKIGIEARLIACVMDADEPSTDALCLHLLELLAARNELSKNGPGHIAKRRKAISDTMVNYLIATMLEAFDWNDGEFRVPASLVVLILNQLGVFNPDLQKRVDLKQKQHLVAMVLAETLSPGEKLSVRKLAALGQLPKSTAARWLKDEEFVEDIRRHRVV